MEDIFCGNNMNNSAAATVTWKNEISKDLITSSTIS